MLESVSTAVWHSLLKLVFTNVQEALPFIVFTAGGAEAKQSTSDQKIAESVPALATDVLKYSWARH